MPRAASPSPVAADELAAELSVPVTACAAVPEALEPSGRAELGELLLGTAPGRASLDEITVFESFGRAAEDLAAACYLYRQALRHGAGTAAEF